MVWSWCHLKITKLASLDTHAEADSQEYLATKQRQIVTDSQQLIGKL